MEETINPKPARTLRIPTNKSRKKLIVFIVLAILIVGTATGIYFIRPKNQIPDKIIKEVNFTVYYPKELPDGYELDKSSLRQENDIIFYNLKKGNENITITEQEAPQQSFDFKQTPGFGEVPASAGTANVGLVNDHYLAILIANKTLINLAVSSQDISAHDSLVQILQNMAEVSS